MFANTATTGLLLASTLFISEAAAAAISSSSTKTSTTSLSSSTILAVSSTATVTAGGKRGLSYNDASLTKAFNSSAITWTYNWAQSPGASTYNSALEFVPMLWSNASSLTSTWSTNAQAAINAGSQHLFSFNEPDLCAAGAGSSCMTLNSSVAAYKKYMQPFAGKALLGAPAVTNGVGTDSAPLGAQYLQQFIGNCTGCTIDFVNMHWYSNIYAGINYLQSQVESIRAVAGGRPIWVTEFGITTENAYTEAQLESFLQEAMEYLDSQPDVAGYAYFWDAPGVLMNSAGTAVSSLGALYNSYDAVVPSSNASSAASSTSSVSSSSSTVSQSSTASASVTTAPTCPSASGSAYVDANGATYNIYCSSDTSIGAYANASITKDWTQCASLCDASSSCVAFVYQGVANGVGSGYCYFKNNIGNVFASSNTLVAGVLASSSSSSASSTVSSTTSRSSTTSTLISATSSTSTTSSVSSSRSSTLSTMTSTTSKSSSTSTKAAATSASTAKNSSIKIVSAFFARSNVTVDARNVFLSGNNLVIDSLNPGGKLGGNPWVGHPNKTLSILYTNDQDASQYYVFTAVQNSGTYTITPTTTSVAAKKAAVIAAPSGATIDIVAVTFGNIQITDSAVFTKLYNHAKSGASFTINPTFFNTNPMAGIQKTAIIWYKQNGALKALTGYGGNSYTF